MICLAQHLWTLSTAAASEYSVCHSLFVPSSQNFDPMGLLADKPSVVTAIVPIFAY